MNEEEAAEVLGVDINDSEEKIKEKYRDLVKSTHPDQGGSADQFKEITRAKNILVGDHSESNKNSSPTRQRRTESGPETKAGESSDTKEKTTSNEKNTNYTSSKNASTEGPFVTRRRIAGAAVGVILTILMLNNGSDKHNIELEECEFATIEVSLSDPATLVVKTTTKVAKREEKTSYPYRIYPELMSVQNFESYHYGSTDCGSVPEGWTEDRLEPIRTEKSSSDTSEIYKVTYKIKRPKNYYVIIENPPSIPGPAPTLSVEVDIDIQYNTSG